jgi:hypothetical protein
MSTARNSSEASASLSPIPEIENGGEPAGSGGEAVDVEDGLDEGVRGFLG